MTSAPALAPRRSGARSPGDITLCPAASSADRAAISQLNAASSVGAAGGAIIWVNLAMRAGLDPIRGRMARAILIADPNRPRPRRAGAALRDGCRGPRLRRE